MTKRTSIVDLGNIYESKIYGSKDLISEKASKFPKDTFQPSSKETKEPSTFKDSGPNSADGFNKKSVKKKNKKKVVKKTKNTRKKVDEDINSFMKSKFDKLFENVMDDDLDLNAGPGVGPEGEEGDMGDDLDLDMDSDMDSDTDTDTVTLTLDRDIAQSFCDMLQTALGGESDMMGDEDEDLEDLEIEDSEDDMLDFGDDDEDESFKEETGTEKLPDSTGHKLTKGQDVPGNVVASKDKASSDVTDETGNSQMGDPMKHNSKLTKPGTVGKMKAGQSIFGKRS